MCVFPYLLNITHFYDHNNFIKFFFIRKLFVLLLLATFGTSSQILKLKVIKIVCWNILPIIEKIQKRTPKNQKFENPSTTRKFYVDLGPKRYLGPRDPIIGSMGYGVRVRILIP